MGFSGHRIGSASARLAALCGVLLGAGATARAAEPAPDATIAVSLRADGVPAWQARAVEHALALDLVGGRLGAPAKPVPPPACATTDLECAIAGYRDAGVDLAVTGALSPGRLRYRILMTWPTASPPVVRGSTSTIGVGRAGLAAAMHEALRPILRPGGPLDHMTSAPAGEVPASLPVPGARGTAAAVVLLVLALLLLALLVPGARAGGLPRLGALRPTLAAAVGLIATAVALLTAAPWIAGSAWMVYVAGGLAWGWFAAVTLPHLFPPLGGLERVEHGDLFRLLRAWAVLSLQRIGELALFYAPFALILWAACAALDVPAAIAVGVVAPLWGLVIRLAVRVLVEAAALRLDGELVTGEASADDPWHQAVHAYVLGYIKRAGWPVDDDLLEDLLFLPGEGDDIVLYGGGLTRDRIVIGRPLLERALAPQGRPHDYAAPRVSKLHWTEWNAGLVVPLEVDATIATREDRQPREGALDEGESEHVVLGEPRTLAGIVEPRPLDPRDHHRPWEDPAWLDYDAGEEYDGTDASDKDFLFGAIVRELGRIQRREDRAATLGLVARRWLARRPALARAWERVAAPLRAAFSRYPAVIGDAFAALNFARHHLIQDLARRAWHREELLTARAYAPELERRTGEILAGLDADQTSEPRTSGATARRRLRWMGALAHRPVRDARSLRRRRIAVIGVVAAALGALIAGVIQSVVYHPTYVERMAVERQRLEESRAPAPPTRGPSDDQGK